MEIQAGNMLCWANDNKRKASVVILIVNKIKIKVKTLNRIKRLLYTKKRLKLNRKK